MEELKNPRLDFFVGQILQAGILANSTAWDSPEIMASVIQYSVIYAEMVIKELEKERN